MVRLCVLWSDDDTFINESIHFSTLIARSWEFVCSKIVSRLSYVKSRRSTVFVYFFHSIFYVVFFIFFFFYNQLKLGFFMTSVFFPKNYLRMIARDIFLTRLDTDVTWLRKIETFATYTAREWANLTNFCVLLYCTCFTS